MLVYNDDGLIVDGTNVLNGAGGTTLSPVSRIDENLTRWGASKRLSGSVWPASDVAVTPLDKYA